MAQRGPRGGTLRIDASDAIIDETMGVLRVKFGWDGTGFIPSVCTC